MYVDFLVLDDAEHESGGIFALKVALFAKKKYRRTHPTSDRAFYKTSKPVNISKSSSTIRERTS